MQPDKDNIARLKEVSQGLEELNSQVVFVGGCVAQLYATGEAATEPHPTMDVDLVVDRSSYKEYNEFCELLRNKRFRNDTTFGAPICRWTFLDEIVDVMPTNEKILGFSNRWYKAGIAHKVIYEISEGLFINIMPAIYFVASKMEAVFSRGGADLRYSHDFEDIVYVLNYCPEFTTQLAASADTELRQYLKNSFSKLLSRNNIREEIECMLPREESARVGYIQSLMVSITRNQ